MATAKLDLGGGKVRRSITAPGIRAEFDENGGRIPVGTILSSEELGKFRLANLRSAVERKIIEIWPAAAVHGGGGQLFAVPREDGLFDLVRGAVVSDEPMTKHRIARLIKKEAN